jgi:hypothetical protein
MAQILLTFFILPFTFIQALLFSGSDEVVFKKPEKQAIKAIYWTAYTAGWKERREELINLIEETELNAVVIDMKDSTGRIFFDSSVPMVDEIGAEDIRIPDLDELLKTLDKKGIYKIARVAIFQDPHLAENKHEYALKRTGGGLWRDWKGLAWVDSTSRDVWKYNLDIIKQIVDLGFDEINFDYIRFPSDGDLNAIEYPFYDEIKPKTEAMNEFFEYVDKQLTFEEVATSVDLFGMVLVRDDGLGIGQRFEDAADHFDYIAPMVYPSHYPDGYEGFTNPADFPYEIVYGSLDKAKEGIKGKRAHFRPWLQDFDLGAVYTADMVRKQIEATYDAGWGGWFLWNASNRYTQGGVLKED